MHPELIQRITGMLLLAFSATLLPPMLVSLIYHDQQLHAFIPAFLMTSILGSILMWGAEQTQQEMRLHDGFLVVLLFWGGLGSIGALPFMVGLDLPFYQALFESFSGLTTTGATVLTGLDELPKSLLFYRQEQQWLGGMGIIVLAVAVLPMLGIGGMQMYRAETPGPVKDDKLTPRITETAKALWLLYFGLTLACALAYAWAGMSWFDAICHSFSTVAIGGFSTHDASMGYFNSPLIECIAMLFMLLAGINFSLHFIVWRHRNLAIYAHDSEFRAYLLMMLTAICLTLLGLLASHTLSLEDGAARTAMFQVISVATTTGFATTDFYTWPPFLTTLLMLTSFAGGCAGSTGGGMKVIRVVLLAKQAAREIKQLIHPNAYIPVRMAGKTVPDRVTQAVWGFLALYVGCFCLITLLLTATGLDMVSAFSATLASMNNLGPGLGSVGANYAHVSPAACYILSLAMLLGRLELFTLVVVLTPWFWQR